MPGPASSEGKYPPTNPAIRVWFMRNLDLFKHLLLKTEGAIYWRKKADFPLTVWVKGKRSPNKLALWSMRLDSWIHRNIYSTTQLYEKPTLATSKNN